MAIGANDAITSLSCKETCVAPPSRATATPAGATAQTSRIDTHACKSFGAQRFAARPGRTPIAVALFTAEAMRIAKNDARIAAFGLLPTKEPAPLDLDPFFTKSLTMHAVHGSQNQPGLPDFREALDFITHGEIDVSSLLSHRFPITRVQEAFDLAYSGEDRALKVAVSFES